MKHFHFILFASLFFINTIHAMQDIWLASTDSSSSEIIEIEPKNNGDNSCLSCDCNYSSQDAYTKHLSSQSHMIKLVLIYKNTLRPITAIPVLPQKREIPSVATSHIKKKKKKKEEKWCQLCSKSLIGSFKLHMRTHTNETPYHCSVCSHPTSQRVNCQRHIRSEHFAKGQNAHIIIKLPGRKDIVEEVGKQYFECSVCGNGFHEKSAYSRHEKKHSLQEN